MPEELLGSGRVDVRQGHPLAGGGPAAAGHESVYVRVKAPLVSERLNWKWGCVALDDPDIRELFRVVPLGTPVEILP